MSLLPFLRDGFGNGGVNRAPILFVTDDRRADDRGTGGALRCAALHEFAEIPPGGCGVIQQTAHNVRMLGGHISGFTAVGLQVEENGMVNADERLVLVPEWQLFLLPGQGQFPIVHPDCLEILAVVIVEWRGRRPRDGPAGQKRHEADAVVDPIRWHRRADVLVG